MTESELRTLPRKLAERAINQKCELRGGDAPFGWSADAHEVYAFGRLVLQTEDEKRADKCYAELITKAEAVIREAIEQTLESATQAIEERIKEVATEICKGESATASHALLTHIAIPQALAAIRSLKPAKSDMTQPAEERG